jgi:hypothetical protein
MQESRSHFDISPLIYYQCDMPRLVFMKLLTCVVGIKATVSIADIYSAHVSHWDVARRSSCPTVWSYVYFRLVARMGAFLSASARRPGLTAEEENSVFKSRKAFLTPGVS